MRSPLQRARAAPGAEDGLGKHGGRKPVGRKDNTGLHEGDGHTHRQRGVVLRGLDGTVSSGGE